MLFQPWKYSFLSIAHCADQLLSHRPRRLFIAAGFIPLDHNFAPVVPQTIGSLPRLKFSFESGHLEKLLELVYIRFLTVELGGKVVLRHLFRNASLEGAF